MVAASSSGGSMLWRLLVACSDIILLPAACVAVLLALIGPIREADGASRVFLAAGGLTMTIMTWNRCFRASAASRRWRQARFLAAPVAQSRTPALSLAADVLFAASFFCIGLVLGGYNLLGGVVQQAIADWTALACTLVWPWLLMSSFVAEAWVTAALGGGSPRLRGRARWTTGQAFLFALGFSAIFLLPSLGDGALAYGLAGFGVALCIAGLLCLARAERVGLQGES